MGCRVGEVWLGLQGSHCSAKLIDRARAPPLPFLSPRVEVGLGLVTSCWNTRFLGGGVTVGI